jgi:RNA polymerase sigma-70 factor (ECF subfamily)
LRATLERAIGRLKPRQREVFLLFEVEGFKHGEIAEILQRPEGTSKAALFDARRELRELIKATPAPGAAS